VANYCIKLNVFRKRENKNCRSIITLWRCANAVICLIMDNDCESVWNVSLYCISGEKIQIQVYCISDTDTKYRSQNVSNTRCKIHFSYLRYLDTCISNILRSINLKKLFIKLSKVTLTRSVPSPNWIVVAYFIGRQ